MLRIGRFFDLDSLCGYKRAEIEVRNSVTIDWAVRENVRAQMRVIIKRILRKYGYPPDKQARATELVLEQAEVLCRDGSEGE